MYIYNKNAHYVFTVLFIYMTFAGLEIMRLKVDYFILLYLGGFWGGALKQEMSYSYFNAFTPLVLK